MNDDPIRRLMPLNQLNVGAFSAFLCRPLCQKRITEENNLVKYLILLIWILPP